MHSITIALYHKELGTNPERITKKLIAYAEKFNWHDIDFPASYQDYVIFEKSNEDVALCMCLLMKSIFVQNIYQNAILIQKIK